MLEMTSPALFPPRAASPHCFACYLSCKLSTLPWALIACVLL